ncbi:MAG: hypothetical protein R3E55_08065 [Burkholderiaceae bacterium]
MCDAFLNAGTPFDKGLSCFCRMAPGRYEKPVPGAAPGEREDGQRLNASSRDRAARRAGWMVGEEGRGVRNIIEMVAMTL